MRCRWLFSNGFAILTIVTALQLSWHSRRDCTSSKRRRPTPRCQGQSGYSGTNCRLAGHGGLELYTKVENLFDERPYEDGFIGPNRWAVAGVRLRF